MNCQNFETVINDLAREQIMDAAARDSGLEHASACARCAARLADERMLSAGLRRLAASANMEEAPARVEARLLEALRERQPLAPSTVVVNRFRRLAIGVAAAILIVLALAAIRFSQSGEVTPVEQAQELKPDHRSAEPKKIEQAPVLAVNQTRSPGNRPRRDVVRHQKKSPVHRVDPDATHEIATDFIPLVQGDSLNLMESGQLVRVELPRSALVSFGLPMNMERAYERVKADVVVGNDGLARAIRFVR
jgi:tetrahydromethanopterin S-methyltransferase subunit F